MDSTSSEEEISRISSCKPKTVELRETELCYRDSPIHSVGKLNFCPYPTEC